MSVVIVGGHDRMVCQYKKICKGYKCKAKVFTQMSANLSEQIGTPDLLILFTNTVSHKMVRCAVACLLYTSSMRLTCEAHFFIIEKYSFKIIAQMEYDA